MIKLEEELKKGISRRAFNAGALAAAATLAGCGGGGESDTIVIGGTGGGETVEPEVAVRTIYGTGTHNCGGRCVVRADVANGRIIRILTDDNEFSGDGTPLDDDSRNLPQTRPCSRCRGYRYRVHHPGRLRYPLKQTKKRGDLSGFKRISWDEALNAVALKHKNVYDKYGLDGIYVLYDSAANNGVQGRDALEQAYRFMGYAAGQNPTPYIGTNTEGYGGALWKDQFGTYSAHQNAYIGVGYTGMNDGVSANDIAKNSKAVVMWGDNRMTTNNNVAYSYAKVAEELKAKGVKTYYVGPHFSDSGIVLADEWLVSKPFTDPALTAGMLYHMLDNTFDLSTGALKADPWLDIDWLDTMVYGFFDSPEYDLDETTGDITVPATNPTPTGHRKVPAVLTGKSYASWILGDNANALDYSATTTNYTAGKFTGTKRWAPCAYEVTKGSATVYKTKQNFQTPKKPAWAAAVTGIPESRIMWLAEVFAKGGPVASFWSGGFQKQAEGVINEFAVQALHVITKNVSKNGTTFAWGMSPSVTAPIGALPNMSNSNISINTPSVPQRPTASCTAWHTIIKAAFMDELRAPATDTKGQYTARYIPNWPKKADGTLDFTKGVAYWDDGGTKAAAVQWKRTWNGTRAVVGTYTDGTNNYFDWAGRTGTDGTPSAHDGTPIYAGIRLMYNSASNIIINQHENSNDSREMLECLYPDDGEADTFCLVTFDNFMSPTARWSDYVLPTSTAWEHPNYASPAHSGGYFVPQAVNPPGESKQAWSLAIEFLRAYENVQGTAANHKSIGVAASYAGGSIANSIEGIAKARYYDNSPTVLGPYNDPSSRFYQVSFYSYMNTTGNSTLFEYYNPATSLLYTESEYLAGPYLDSASVFYNVPFNDYKTGTNTTYFVPERYRVKYPYTEAEYYGNTTPKGPYYNPNSPFYGKSWEEYIKNPVLKSKANDLAVIAPKWAQTRANYDNLTAAAKLNPFIKNTTGYFVTTNEYNKGSYYEGGTASANTPDLFYNTSAAPRPSLRYQVYSPIFTWQYENLFNKWHGFLPAAQRGQPHRDFEGDRIVLEIPLYYAYEDYFLEAYGNNPARVADLPFLMTTTHDKYRSHSSLAENPILRELCHRVPGRDSKGKPKQGNDAGYYAMGATQDFAVNKTGSIPELSSTINPDGSVSGEFKEIASYSEIWINETDGGNLNIGDGDLVLVENPIGAVYCVARLSKRCARGYVDLHQGCWYDPRPLPNSYGHESVDVGGNCNTLMASQPSRVDHGNGQQSAMVKISKVNY